MSTRSVQFDNTWEPHRKACPQYLNRTIPTLAYLASSRRFCTRFLVLINQSNGKGDSTVERPWRCFRKAYATPVLCYSIPSALVHSLWRIWRTWPWSAGHSFSLPTSDSRDLYSCGLPDMKISGIFALACLLATTSLGRSLPHAFPLPIVWKLQENLILTIYS